MGKMVFITKIRHLLKEKGITQQQFAEQINMRPSYLSDMVNDRRGVINKEHLLTVYKALGCTDIRQLIDIVDEDDLQNKDS